MLAFHFHRPQAGAGWAASASCWHFASTTPELALDGRLPLPAGMNGPISGLPDGRRGPGLPDERPEVQVATQSNGHSCGNGHTQQPSLTTIPFLFRQMRHPRRPCLHVPQPSLASGSGGSAKSMRLRLPRGARVCRSAASGPAEAGRLHFAFASAFAAPVACTKMPAPGGALGSRLHVGAPWPSGTRESFGFRPETWFRTLGWMEIICGSVACKCVSTKQARSASASSTGQRAGSMPASASVRPATHPSGGNCHRGGGSPPRRNDHALTNQRPQVLSPPLFMLSGTFSNLGAVFVNSSQCRLVRAFLSDM